MKAGRPNIFTSILRLTKHVEQWESYILIPLFEDKHDQHWILLAAISWIQFNRLQYIDIDGSDMVFVQIIPSIFILPLYMNTNVVMWWKCWFHNWNHTPANTYLNPQIPFCPPTVRDRKFDGLKGGIWYYGFAVSAKSYGFWYW